MVPDDFVAFVASNGRRIARACAEIAGNDQVAEALRAELLAGVAGRWRRWPVESRAERALARIEHRLHRGARAAHVVASPAAFDLRASLRLRLVSDPADPADESGRLAAAAWSQARRVRRWWTGAGVAAAGALAVVLLVPPATPPPPPLPTRIPAGVTVLPAIEDLSKEQPLFTLPTHLFLDPAAVDRLPELVDAPLEYAVAAAAASGEGLVVAGFEHLDTPDEAYASPRPLQRRLEHAALRGARLLSTSLSPDGALVALPRDGDVVLVDVRTGAVRAVPIGATQPEPPFLTWLDRTTLILPGSAGSLILDVSTNTVAEIDADAPDVLTVRGYRTPRFMDLVTAPPNDAADPIRALLRFWYDADGQVVPAASTAHVSTERTLTGPPWLGAWAGPGWAAPLLVARAADPTTLLLPQDVGPASAVVTAIIATGGTVATLAATGGLRLEVLGFLGPERILVAARSEGSAQILVWDPRAGTVATVILVNADAVISVADLLTLPCHWCPQRMPQENAEIPVNA